MSEKTDVPARTLELYDRLVATNPDLKRKGKTMPYTSLNGHMFSFLTKEGMLALRLKEYFDISFEYIGSLKPKPTKKK